MGAVIGDLLPLAVGVAISPIPIIAVILMLLAPRAGAASMGFTLGWTIGIVAVTGETAPLPKWMSAVDRVTPVKATGLGTLLSAVNPKNLLLCVAAGVTVGSAGLSAGDAVLAVLLLVIGASLVGKGLGGIPSS